MIGDDCSESGDLLRLAFDVLNLIFGLQRSLALIELMHKTRVATVAAFYCNL